MICREKIIDIGTVTTKISTSRGLIVSIMMNEPITVITLLTICSRSFDSEALTVSIS